MSKAPKRQAKARRFEIENPLVVMFQEGDGAVCHLYPPEGYDHRTYGIIICDLVRHVANAFNVPEGDVWEWVDRERHNPTSPVIKVQ